MNEPPLSGLPPFRVRARGSAVEDVVRGDVHQEGAGSLAAHGEIAWAEGVDRHGIANSRLGRIDGVVGGGVEDYLRALAPDALRDCPCVTHVEILAVTRPGDIATQEAEDAATQLPSVPDDESLHASIRAARSRSRSVRPPASWLVSVNVTLLYSIRMSG
jgi:hypothetical protein